MLSVSTALESLYRCLDEAFPPSPGTRIFDVPFALNDAFDPAFVVHASAAVAAVLRQQRSGVKNWPRWGPVQIFASLERAHAFCASRGVTICEFVALMLFILNRAC